MKFNAVRTLGKLEERNGNKIMNAKESGTSPRQTLFVCNLHLLGFRYNGFPSHWKTSLSPLNVFTFSGTIEVEDACHR